MKAITILSFCIKNCGQIFNQRFNITVKNTCIPFHNLSNVFRFCSSSNYTPTNEQYFKIRDLNRQLLTKIVPSLEKDEKSTTICTEIEFVIAKNRRFPENITIDQLKSLCNLETRTQRLEYLSFLFKKERHKISDALKKLEKRKERTLKKPDLVYSVTNPSIKYGLGRNSILLSVRTHAMNKFYKYRLAYATLFGEKIVLDLSYDPFMTEKEKSACVTQLALIYSANRKNRDPYDLHFCNAISSYMCVKKFQNFLPKAAESFVTLTEKSYLNIFPKEKLVYLSPHAKETLQEYDHNAVYVIGAFVDTVKKQKLSFNKADSEEIKSYSLPLDDYVMWGAGTKSLTVNQVFEIMLIMKNTGDWKKAFEVIPTRKIRRLDKEQIEKQNVPDKIFLVNSS
ncbi:mitochondrial ribonuclease P protein 1 homolog [Argiope bruennichi]|uniref:mitochondrial ribonuclease P protein 1 homolog n=1 Tax=Argiope bruennichi TaxID=94029 RepID=UPI002493F4E3|nr:mitochondrial ribonuclease P protein 1 homolog [Argiope bruennichi]